MQCQAKHIMLAEDDEDDSQFFKEALKYISDPPSLVRAKDGVELTNFLQNSETLPDVVFLDLNMPRKNGAQCLTEIREREEFQHLPVVVLSTSNSVDIIEKMYDFGANLYVQKPTDLRSWGKTIARVLGMDWNIQRPFSVKKNFILTEF